MNQNGLPASRRGCELTAGIGARWRSAFSLRKGNNPWLAGLIDCDTRLEMKVERRDMIAPAAAAARRLGDIIDVRI